MFLVLVLRISGKREVGQMSILETDGSISVIPMEQAGSGGDGVGDSGGEGASG